MPNPTIAERLREFVATGATENQSDADFLRALADEVQALEEDRRIARAFSGLAIEHFSDSEVCRRKFERDNPELIEAMARVVIARAALKEKTDE